MKRVYPVKFRATHATENIVITWCRKLHDERRANSKQSLIGEENWTLVRTLLKQKWSPEQISGWLRNNSEINFYVSDQTIYEYIYADRDWTLDKAIPLAI